MIHGSSRSGKLDGPDVPGSSWFKLVQAGWDPPPVNLPTPCLARTFSPASTRLIPNNEGADICDYAWYTAASNSS